MCVCFHTLYVCMLRCECEYGEVCVLCVCVCVRVSSPSALSTSVDVRVKRLGGAYGAKITRGHQAAAACALGACLTRRWALIRVAL